MPSCRKLWPLADALFTASAIFVAGLLAGRDLVQAAEDPEPNDLILVPGEALNADHLFIDSLSLSDLREAMAPARVIPALEITEALRKL